MDDQNIKSTGCCEPFNPEPWEDKEITWGKKLKKLYLSYTTCPKCAKAYGKNYVVLFAQIE